MKRGGMRIGIASDHGGFALKSFLVDVLAGWGYQVEDAGVASDVPVDYPPIIAALAARVGKGEIPRGIVLCGSGIGASIVANKIRGVRCALCHDPLSAELSRRHNDANMLALGGRLVGSEMARRVVEVWLRTEFEGERHLRRIRQIEDLECADG
ncbi:MAG: ribose 5-phosphate isomerase B, partial [Candidatus Eisenbacteria bacterium]|nr:ribose 5-phosphate isomerase B [Candidatus Eisenbacteria bacterium]